MRYVNRCVGLMEVLLNSKGIRGYCYTQLTDIEQEMNGLYTYRREKKFSDENYQRIREMKSQESGNRGSIRQKQEKRL